MRKVFRRLAGNTWSAEYEAALWEKTRPYTIPLLRDATHALTSLIYTAWTESGKPAMNTALSWDAVWETGNLSRKGITLSQNYPNPFRESTTLRFHLQTRREELSKGLWKPAYLPGRQSWNGILRDWSRGITYLYWAPLTEPL